MCIDLQIFPFKLHGTQHDSKADIYSPDQHVPRFYVTLKIVLFTNPVQ